MLVRTECHSNGFKVGTVKRQVNREKGRRTRNQLPASIESTRGVETERIAANLRRGAKFGQMTKEQTACELSALGIRKADSDDDWRGELTEGLQDQTDEGGNGEGNWEGRLGVGRHLLLKDLMLGGAPQECTGTLSITVEGRAHDADPNTEDQPPPNRGRLQARRPPICQKFAWRLQPSVEILKRQQPWTMDIAPSPRRSHHHRF